MDDSNNFSTGLQIDGENLADEIITELTTRENVTFKNITIQGNLEVDGEEIINKVETFSVLDPIVEYNRADPPQNADVGWTAKSNDSGSAKYKGAIIKSNTDVLTVYNNATNEPLNGGLQVPYSLGSVEVRDAVASDEVVNKRQLDSKADVTGDTFTGPVTFKDSTAPTPAEQNVEVFKTSYVSGNEMNVVLDMKNNTIKNVFDAQLLNEAVNLGQVTGLLNNKLNLTGGTLSGAINLSDNKITNLEDATDAQDSVNLRTLETKISEIDLDPNSWTFDTPDTGNDCQVEINYDRETGVSNLANFTVRYAITATDGNPVIDQRKAVFSFRTFFNADGTNYETPIIYFGQSNDDYIGMTYVSPNADRSAWKFIIRLKHITTTAEDVRGTVKIDFYGNGYTLSNAQMIDLGVKNTPMPSVPDTAVVAFKSDTGSGDYLSSFGGSLSGNLNMLQNSILNIPLVPTVDNECASKNYVDTSVTSVSSQLSNFVNKSGDTMTGQLNMGGSNRIVNCADAVNILDVVNKRTLDNAIANNVNDGYTIFPIWAEENDIIDNGATEWAFGNGDNSEVGITIPINCELFAISFSTDDTTINFPEIAVLRNSVQVASITATTQRSFTTLSSTVNFVAGQEVNFQTILRSGVDESGSRVCAWFRVRATPASTSVLSDLLDVSISGVQNGDALVYNGSTFVSEPVLLSSGGTLNGNLSLEGIVPTIDIKSTSGNGTIHQKLNITTHASNRGGGISWLDNSNNNRRIYFGRAYQAGSTINGITLNTTTSGQNVESNSDAATVALKILDNRNVGIGTTNPVQKLDVNGSAIIRGSLDVNNNRVSNVSDPVQQSDAVNLSYLQNSLNSNVSGFFFGDNITASVSAGSNTTISMSQISLVGGRYIAHCQVNLVTENYNNDITGYIRILTDFGSSSEFCTIGCLNLLSAAPISNKICFFFYFPVTVPIGPVNNLNPVMILRKARNNNINNVPPAFSLIGWNINFIPY